MMNHRINNNSSSSSPTAASPRRKSTRVPVPVNPNVMPSGAAELSKRPVSIPNPQLPSFVRRSVIVVGGGKMEEEEKKEEDEEMEEDEEKKEEEKEEKKDTGGTTDADDGGSIGKGNTGTNAKANSKVKTVAFPVWLHSIISSSSSDQSNGAITWTDDGDAFTINDREAFRRDVLNHRHHLGGGTIGSYNALVRTLIRFGFQAVPGTSTMSSTWTHPGTNFHRDFPKRCRDVVQSGGGSIADALATKLLLADDDDGGGAAVAAAAAVGNNNNNNLDTSTAATAADDDSPTNEPTFPQILHQLLSDKTNHDAISWSEDGKSFALVHTTKWKKILRLKMGLRFSTFIRNLSKWGFERDGSTEPWSHPLFRRNMPLQVSKMTRKRQKGSSGDTPRSPQDQTRSSSARSHSNGKKTSDADAVDLDDDEDVATGTADTADTTAAAKGGAANATEAVIKPSGKKGKKQNWKSSFPTELYWYLSDPSNSDAIAWTHDGCAFSIVDKEAFCNVFLPQKAGITFSSFVWALSVWGFQSLLLQGNPMSWYHPMFQKSRPDLVEEIKVATSFTSQGTIGNREGYGPTGNKTNGYGSNLSPLVSPARDNTTPHTSQPQQIQQLQPDAVVTTEPEGGICIAGSKQPPLPVGDATFPEQLRALLSNAANHQYIRWNSHGKTFSVVDKLGFEKVVLVYNGSALGISGYKAFEATVSEWGFSLVARDEEFDIWFNSDFQRDGNDAVAKGPRGRGAQQENSEETYLDSAAMDSSYPVDAFIAPNSISHDDDDDDDLDDETPPAYPLTFLQKLRAALSDIANKDVISWNASGTAFAMQYSNDRFKRDVLGHVFGAITYEHLADELVRYGFTMISEIPGRSSAWQCDLFQRDLPDVDDADVYGSGMEETSSESYDSSAIAVGSINGAGSNTTYHQEGHIEYFTEARPRASSKTRHRGGSLLPTPQASSDVDASMGEASSDNSDSEDNFSRSRSIRPPAARRKHPRAIATSSRKRSHNNGDDTSTKKAKIAQKPRNPPKKTTTTKKGRKAAAATTTGSYTTFVPRGVDSKVAKAIQKVNSEAGGGHKKEATLAAAFKRGITMRPSGKWQAQLYFAGRSRYVGVFDTKEKAMLAHEIFRVELQKYKGKADRMTAKECGDAVVAARKEATGGVNTS
mmetsp:Transcript_6572/g.12808  ORF Transcript_6572/g.12808 Transcript_6572/m.12808 type:complete len:1154 (-) Transcript_6572:425-3886(-)